MPRKLRSALRAPYDLARGAWQLAGDLWAGALYDLHTLKELRRRD